MPPRGSFLLFGPRGTGKSTWLHQHYPDAVYLDLLDPETFRTCLARPERLREIVEGSPQTRTVVIDEIQKVPALLDMVHNRRAERRPDGSEGARHGCVERHREFDQPPEFACLRPPAPTIPTMPEFA